MKLIESNKKLREFGFLIGIGFPIILGWLIPKFGGHEFKFWTLFIAVPHIILAIIKPSFLILPYSLWMKFGNILGNINSKLIFFTIYLFILLPIAFIMYILKYDPLQRRKSNLSSYRQIKKNWIVDLTRIF